MPYKRMLREQKKKKERKIARDYQITSRYKSHVKEKKNYE